MLWQDIAKQVAIPTLAFGIITAIIFTVQSTKPNKLSAYEVSSTVDRAENFSEQLWEAGLKDVHYPVEFDLLTESAGASATWVETRSMPAVVGHQAGKLVITREFGPSEDTDATDVARDSNRLLRSVTLGFRAFSDIEAKWRWAKFTPTGEVKIAPDGAPLTGHIASLTTAHCGELGWIEPNISG
ncbi:MAG: hypothetical protein ACKVGZ_06395 [Alphaproteobacteria bacterium]